MKFLPKYIEEYAEQHTNVFESSVLSELERRTHVEVMRPHMLSGYMQGQFLSFLSNMKQPKNILEIGTFTGYSAICLAQGLLQGGVLHTIDVNEELTDIATRFIEKAGLSHCIVQHQGDALDIIPSLKGTKWDIVFLDADKLNYGTYYDMVFDHLNVGGILIADNVLWYGNVAKGSKEKRAAALTLFNQKVQDDSRVKNLLLPLRDGLMLVEKISG